MKTLNACQTRVLLTEIFVASAFGKVCSSTNFDASMSSSQWEFSQRYGLI